MHRLIATLLLLLVSACASQGRQDALQATLYEYAAVVRWGSFEQAYEFVDPDVRAAQPWSALERERYKQFRVALYEDAPPTLDDDGTARVLVRIELVNIHTQVPRTITDRQRWRYDPKLKRWWLVSGLPRLTE